MSGQAKSMLSVARRMGFPAFWAVDIAASETAKAHIFIASFGMFACRAGWWPDDTVDASTRSACKNCLRLEAAGTCGAVVLYRSSRRRTPWRDLIPGETLGDGAVVPERWNARAKGA